METNTVVAVIAGAGTVAASIITSVFKYVGYKSRQDKLLLVGHEFASVVASLASDNPTQRLGGAILLRRFHDPTSEVGEKSVPYSQEAVRVSAAMLRGQQPSDFQKLLADGLAFAGSLAYADLQRTNLQNAYLGAREQRDGTIAVTDLSYADFYRADLSGASLKRAKAIGAKFYQARLHNTVLRDANLQHANFYGADLKNANFAGASLEGANFSQARNLPADIHEKLNRKGIYQTNKHREDGEAQVVEHPTIFVSKPGAMTLEQEMKIRTLEALLDAEAISTQKLERVEYTSFGELDEVRRVMSGCAGAVIFGFSDLVIHSGEWRPGTRDEKPVRNAHRATSWSQIEAGIAVTHGLPILILHERGIDDGIFGITGTGHRVYRTAIDADWSRAFRDWCADVRERFAFR